MTELIFLLVAILGFSMPMPWPWIAPPHELPDGFVERGIAIVVRDDFARIEYRIGASDETMRSQLAEWKIGAESLSGEELHQQFADSALACLPGEMRVFSDGRALELVPVEVRVGGQHHVSAVVTMDVPVTGIQGLARLRMEDHAFRSLDGAVRLAIKSSGEVMTRNSKFAPALVRAERQVLPLVAGSDGQSPVEMRVQMIFPGGVGPQPGGAATLAPGDSNDFGPKGIRLDRGWLEKDSAPPEENGSSSDAAIGLVPVVSR